MNSYNETEDSSEVKGYLMNWLSVSADNIVILILLLALAIKFIFFEDKEDIAKQLQFKVEDDTEEKIENECVKEKKFEIEYVKDKENENEDMSFSFLTTKMPFKLSFAKMQTISIPWIDGKEEQIDEKQCTVDISNDKNLFSRIPRSVEECLKIYKSEVNRSIINIYIYFNNIFFIIVISIYFFQFFTIFYNIKSIYNIFKFLNL